MLNRASDENNLNTASQDQEIEDGSSQEQEAESQATDISDTAAIGTDCQSDAGNVASSSGLDTTLHVEGGDQVTVEENAPDLSSTDEGDCAGLATKSDSDVQGNDASQVQMNGPV